MFFFWGFSSCTGHLSAYCSGNQAQGYVTKAGRQASLTHEVQIACMCASAGAVDNVVKIDAQHVSQGYLKM